ncbi:restriction endonuclease subunit S [Lactococcus petauri]|uniref:restriction endonuclease subunit S n=1 Tax=Lactococcus petauri TaxID=1940789 RepID=UPI0003080FA4|nr:restriction endonuclease subunit S [Lactococcus petauri]MBK4109702.1 restriction endonuclease subunit S [Lactococcus petauri]
MTENQDNNSYFSSDSTVKFDGSLLNLIQGAEVEYNTLGEVAEIWDGTHQTPKYIDSGIPFVSVENIKNLKATTKYISAEDFKKYKAKPQKGDILMSRIGTIGEVAVVTDDEPLAYYVTLALIRPNLEVITAGYLKHVLLGNIGKRELRKRTLVNAVPIKINLGEIGKIKIPIPSLEIQQKVVEILDKMTDYVKELTAELTLRQKQYAYYRAQLLTFDAEGNPLRDSGESLTVRWTTLGEIATIIAGGDLPKNYRKGQTEPSSEFPYPIYSNGTGVQSLYGFTDDFRVDSEAITISARGTLGWHTIREPKFTPIVRLLTLIPNTEIISTKFLNYVLTQVKLGGVKTGIPSLTKPMIEKVSIPVPPLKFQSKIVEILDRFQALIEDVSGLLPEEIASRQKQYEYWREQLLSFKKE